MRENTGKVVLVGAGPGDTGLLTFKRNKYHHINEARLSWCVTRSVSGSPGDREMWR